MELKTPPFLSGLGKDELEVLMEYLEPVEFGPDEDVVVEGTEGNEMFILVDGRIQIFKRVVIPKGGISRVKERSVAVLGPEEAGVVGETSLFTGLPRTATVRTLTRCLFLVLKRDDFNRLMEEHPHVAAKLLVRICKTLCHRVDDLNNKLMKLTTALALIARMSY